MDKTIGRIKDALIKAMQAENEGYHFYMMAASNTRNPKGRETFLALAEEEKLHFRFLKDQHSAFSKTGEADKSVKLDKEKKVDADHPIFSDEIKSRIGDAHFEMTALSIGIQLELSAVTFYKAEAEAAADNAAVRFFFEDLAEWEKGHLTILQNQADELKEAYWNEGGFSPF